MVHRNRVRSGFIVASVVVAGALLLAPRSAHALAAPPCPPVKLLPTAGSIPANLSAFGFNVLNPSTNSVRLFSTSGGNRVEIPVTLAPPVDGFTKITPSAALVAGTSYEIEYSGATCLSGSPSTPSGPYKFTAVAAAPIPTKVGSIQGTPTVATKDFGTTRFTVDATYAIDPEMKPWVGVYELLLVVDGRIIATKTTLTGSDTAKLSATGWCDAANAAANPHQVLLRARLPFSPNIDSAVASSTFDCPAPKLTTPGGAPPSPAGTTPPNPTTPTSPTGTTTVTDGGTNATSGGGSSSSCGSAPGPARGTAAPLFALVAVAATYLRRRAAARRT